MRVLLADDHPLFIEGLRSLLASHGIDVVGTARNGLEAIEGARALHPDVILMDIKMPRMDGLAAMRLIKAEIPELKIVMLTMSAEDEDLFQAIKSGASGYLLKTQETDEFFTLLQDVAGGGVVFSPGIASRILQEFTHPTSPERPPAASLSARETQVLRLVAQGLTYKEAGARLFITERTIKYHMGQIVERLHLANRAQAIEYARRAGLIG